jgi:hypothetical protein
MTAGLLNSIRSTEDHGHKENASISVPACEYEPLLNAETSCYHFHKPCALILFPNVLRIGYHVTDSNQIGCILQYVVVCAYGRSFSDWSMVCWQSRDCVITIMIYLVEQIESHWDIAIGWLYEPTNSCNAVTGKRVYQVTCISFVSKQRSLFLISVKNDNETVTRCRFVSNLLYSY